MKRVAVILAIVLTLSALGSTVYAAQDSLPGDALYPVKLGVERLAMMLRGGDVARAERALGFGDKRVREMVTLTEKGRPEDLNITVDKYCYALNMSLARMEQALGEGGPHAGEIAGLMAETMSQHLSILDELYDIVPDEAKPAIQRAMEEALKCYQRAIQVREQLGLQVFGLATIPVVIQERVEQWIQESAEAGLVEVGQ
jgi:inorganic triphosphatase YgiF